VRLDVRLAWSPADARIAHVWAVVNPGRDELHLIVLDVQPSFSIYCHPELKLICRRTLDRQHSSIPVSGDGRSVLAIGGDRPTTTSSLAGQRALAVGAPRGRAVSPGKKGMLRRERLDEPDQKGTSEKRCQARLDGQYAEVC
jgi:hypothetical protein